MAHGMYRLFSEVHQNAFHFAYHWTRPTDWNFHNYRIPALTVWFILEGGRRLAVAGQEYVLTPGDLIVLPSQSVISTRHLALGARPIEYVSLGLQNITGGQEWTDLYGIPVQMHVNQSEELTKLLHLWEELISAEAEQPEGGQLDMIQESLLSATRTAHYLKWEATFKLWLAYLTSIVKPYMEHANPLYDKRVSMICSFIQSHYAQALTSKDIARNVCLSEGHMRAIFRSAMRISPYQYLLNVRIDKAKRLLLTSKLSLLEISNKVGFEDESHFISMFRKRVDMTPGQYRKKVDWVN
jgi:AraC-like DNA-binding protein